MNRCLFAFFSTFLVLHSASASLIFRTPDVSAETYQKILKNSLDHQTPMQALENRLQNDDLPLAVQRDLDHALQQLSGNSKKSRELLKDLYLRLREEPLSGAMREALQLTLERMKSFSSFEETKEIQKKLDLLKVSGSVKESWKQNLAQKEVEKTRNELRSRTGGEDLEIFWNGVKWTPVLPIDTQEIAQWIFISSAWQPKMITGTWTEVVNQLREPPQPWVRGTCDAQEQTDLFFARGSRYEIVFSKTCTVSSDSMKWAPRNEMPSSNLQSSDLKPLLWGGLALTAGLLLLSLGGKKIQIQRP